MKKLNKLLLFSKDALHLFKIYIYIFLNRNILKYILKYIFFSLKIIVFSLDGFIAVLF